MGSRSAIQTSRVGNTSGRFADDSIGGDPVAGPLADLLTNLQNLEIKLSEEAGPFDLFGLFLRQESSGKWDLVVAAKWFGDEKRKALEVISARLKRSVGNEGIHLISRIVPLAPHDRFLSDLTSAITIEHGIHELGSCEFGDVSIARAFIVTSARRSYRPRRA